MLRRGFPATRHFLASSLALSLTLLGASASAVSGAIAPASDTPTLSSLSIAQNSIAQSRRFPSENLVTQVRQVASRDLNIPIDNLHIMRYSDETWTDSCLGLGGPAELCAQVMVEGWQMEVSDGEQSWFYRISDSGDTIRRSERSDVLPPSVRDRLLTKAAQQLNIPISELGVISSEPHMWDGCLGIPTAPNQPCTEIGILGWRAVVQRGEATRSAPTWVFHLDQDASEVRLNASAPNPNPNPSPNPNPNPNPNTIPSRISNAELQTWLESQDLRLINPAAVQQRVPTEALITWLETQWQQGANPNQVRTALQSANWLANTEDFRLLDVNGDGEEEWLVSVNLDPNPMHWGNSGDFWIIGDSLLYRFFEPEDYYREGTEANPIPLSQDFVLTAPQVIAVQDYTGDRSPELLLQRQICGAHTCTQSYTVLSYRNGTMRSLLSQTPSLDTDGQSVVMPYSEVKTAEDETGDERPDLILYGGTYGSAGAGVQRPRTEIWSWDGRAMTLEDIRWDPAEYRVHVLYEANYRMAQGDRDRAADLYEQVIEDDSLDDDLWWNPAGSVYDSSRQFAAFRLMLLEMMEGDRDDAEDWQRWLRRRYPNAPITEAARQMSELWSNQASLTTACTAAHNYLVDLEQDQNGRNPANTPTGPLRDMGYGNPSLTGADVCPIELVQASR